MNSLADREKNNLQLFQESINNLSKNIVVLAYINILCLLLKTFSYCLCRPNIFRFRLDNTG